MAWVALGVAIAFEVAGTLLLRMSEGFTRLTPALGAMLAYWACFAFAGIRDAFHPACGGLLNLGRRRDRARGGHCRAMAQ